MILRNIPVRVLCGLLLCLLPALVSPALAQGDGRFRGVILDETGAAVPGVTVVIRNERTGEERLVVSNEAGQYSAVGLRPSVYTIRATLSGFAPVEHVGVPLAAGQEVSLELGLRPSLNEAITVEGTAIVVDTSSASLGVNISEREVLNLPVNGRQMSQLMLQAPGSQNAGTGTWNDVRFSGRANQQNVVRFDGVEASAIVDSAPGNIAGQVASPFKLQASLENVQELRVESNNYPAEYGTGTGGQVSVVTRSGTNTVRASAFEYFRNERLGAPNYFDATRNADGSIISRLPQSRLSQHQFGGSIGGLLVRDRVFFFGGYEGYRLDAGVNFVEAAPSAAAWSRAVPAIAALRPGFTAAGSVLLPGASTDPDFDIYQLQGVERVRENALSLRLDYRLNDRWTTYVRVFHDRGTQTRPQNISGSEARLMNNPTNAIFHLQGTLGNGTLNEFKIGYNAPKAEVTGRGPTAGGIDFSNFAINLSGSVTNTGISGQGASSGIVVPGGLVRANSATNGRALIYDPYSLAFSNALSSLRGRHLIKLGGDVRLIRMTADQRYGTTYVFPNVPAFLANQPQAIQYAGDISAPSVFNNGATGMRHMNQEYFVFYAQDQWQATSNLTVNYGVRYEYYTPLKVRDNLFVKFNLDTGQIDDPATVNVHGVRKDNFQPRLSATYSRGRTVWRTGFGVFVGPGQGEDLIQPVESDVVRTTISSGPLLAYPLNEAAVVAGFVANPNNRSYQPRAYDANYRIPEKVYQYTASMQREVGRGVGFTAAYVGSQGRNLFLRSVANQIVDVVPNPTNPAGAALVIREYSIVQRDAAGAITGVQQPYAEIDFKTSGGHDNYNALMLSLNRRSASGLSANVQYTLGRSKGTSGGSNEADTAANNARTLDQFEYDYGYNKYDVRHTFSASMLYAVPFGHGRRFGSDAGALVNGLLGGWDVGGIFSARSGLPVAVQIVRPDVLYRDAAGNYFANPAAGRTPVINTPGGGASRNVRRPDLVPGVDPYIKQGGLLYLNPEAFAVPMPGAWGNLERNSIYGPGFQQVDMFLSKRVALGGGRSVELRAEVFNLFNAANFANPSATLPSVIPSNSLGGNTLQPGQAYTAATAGSFGRLSSTVGRTVGLGTARQTQLALRLSF